MTFGFDPFDYIDTGEPTPTDLLRAKIVTSEELDSIPELEPLIRGMLNLDTIAWMFGPSGCGKSFAALDMAGCIGAGENWQGFATTKGTVLYVVAEGVRGIKRRVRAWEQAMGHSMQQVHFMPQAVQIGSQSWTYLTAIAADLGALFVVLDTQARMTVGKEENSSMEMGVVMDAMDAMRQATGACVLSVHHTGWEGGHGRGSTAVRGAFDSAIKVERAGDYVTVTSDKEKDMGDFEDVNLRMIPMGESVVLGAVGPVRARPSYAEVESRTRALRRKWWEYCGTRETTPSQLEAAKVAARNTMAEYRFLLIDHGFVHESGSGNMTRVQLLFEPQDQ
jgi:hypothetical protein